MKKVFLGVGHGGKDPGAIGGGLRESDINLSIAQACRAELEKYGVQVLMSRYQDEDDPLNEEARECNAYAPDLAVDVHTNSGGGKGFEVFHTVHGGAGAALAQAIEAEVKAIGQTSRGCKTRSNSQGKDYYGFIRLTDCPAVICECAFIDSPADRAKIDTEAERATFGRAYARGILKTLGIAVKADKPAVSDDAEAVIAAREVQEKAGLEAGTIKYLLNYQYGNALVKKLAKAMKKE